MMASEMQQTMAPSTDPTTRHALKRGDGTPSLQMPMDEHAQCPRCGQIFECCIAVIEHECVDSGYDKKSFIDNSVGIHQENIVLEVMTQSYDNGDDVTDDDVSEIFDETPLEIIVSTDDFEAIPMPTFSDDTPYGGENRVHCFWHGCSKSSGTFDALMSHMKREHTKNKVPAIWKNTYFCQKARFEINSKAKGRLTIKRQTDKKGEASTSKRQKHKKGDSISADTKSDAPACPAIKGPMSVGGELAPDNVTWVVEKCYVKADTNGKPIIPIEVFGLANIDAPLPPGFQRRGGGQLQKTLSEYRVGGIIPHLLSGASLSNLPNATIDLGSVDDDDGGLISATPSLNLEHMQPSAQCAIKPANNSIALATSSDDIVSHPEMLVAVYQQTMRKQKEEDAQKNWKDGIPEVKVKQTWIDHEMPLVKREEKVKRASTPKIFTTDAVDLDEFMQWLHHAAKGKEHSKDVVRGARRAMGALHVDTATPIDDIKVLVGLYIHGQHMILLDINLLHPKCNWTSLILEGLGNYIHFWCFKLKEMKVHGEEGPLDNYKDCLELLLAAVKGGHAKRCKAYKEASYGAKKKEDLYVMKNFPSIKDVIQPAVRKAYCMLYHMGEKYATGRYEAMTPKDRGLANCLIVGAWQCDTFLGRKWEIEHAKRVDVMTAIDSGTGYILATQHKTHKAYGDIIKLITAPGLEEALKVYDKFPRPEGFPYFLVPVKDGAESISFPSYLRTFNLNMLKGAKVKPGTNHWRKKFHCELQKLTKDRDAMKDLMTILDAHGRKIQEKHYIMQDPDDDYVLAKALVKIVLGTTVQWPSKADADKECPIESLEQMLEEMMNDRTEVQDKCQAKEEDEDPDDELDEEWECGSIFGVMPVGHLNLLPIGSIDTGCPVLAITDGSISSGSGMKRKADIAPLQDVSVQETHQVITQITTSKKHLWKSLLYWAPPLFPGHNKQPDLTPDQSKWIMDKLGEWRLNMAGEDPFIKPEGRRSNEWYWDLRVEAIDEEILTKYHSQDICKSHILNKLMKAKAAAQKIAAELADPPNNVD